MKEYLSIAKNLKTTFKLFAILSSLVVFLFASGCTEDEKDPEPTASFTYVASPSNHLEIIFSNTSTDATSYTWDFGDGNKSTDKNPSHVYTETGSFNVRLEVKGTGGTDVLTSEVLVSPPAPVIEFAFSVNLLEVTFTSEAIYEDSVSWDFGDGNTSNLEHPVHLYQYDETDTYTVTLTGYGPGGTTTLSKEVTIENPSPVADFTHVDNGLEISFTDNSLYADSYSWEFGDGATGSGKEVTHSYSTHGTYTVTLTATGKGGSATKTMVVNPRCISNLAGMYTVTTTYGYHDFLPNEPSNTIDVEIFQGASNGEYMVNDFSGGLYSIGSYTSAYGTNGFPVTFFNNCGEITWSGQNDPWGPVVPLSGGVNSVDEATGVITISWFCEAYGENGVSVYTPK